MKKFFIRLIPIFITVSLGFLISDTFFEGSFVASMIAVFILSFISSILFEIMKERLTRAK